MHFGRQKVSAWQELYRGGNGPSQNGELLAPKCSLGALGAHWVPELAGWLAGWLAGRLRQGQGLRQGLRQGQGLRQLRAGGTWGHGGCQAGWTMEGSELRTRAEG